MRILLPLILIPSLALAEMTTATFYTKASARMEGTSGHFTAHCNRGKCERFDENAQTCAHPSLPFNTILKITNPKNGRWYYCRVNDRGPAAWTGHGIDLTPRGFELLQIPRKQGEAFVEIERIK